MDIWVSILLLAIGFAAIFLELFVPAGGLVGLGGVVSMVVAIVLAFVHHGSTEGTLLLIAAMIGTPITLVIAFKIFPHTWVGKRLILKQSEVSEEGFTSSSVDQYTAILGKEGLTISMLRPSGMVRVGDSKYSVVTEGDLIEENTRVKVIAVEGNRIVVRRAAAPDQNPAA